ncbi:antitoxin [bacterium]|nr:antitoxin [bacterium]
MNKLTRSERKIEKDIIKGVYVPVSQAELKEIAQAIARKKKDVVLNIRVNSHDLAAIKQKAKKMGIPYQTFISEVLHRVAA